MHYYTVSRETLVSNVLANLKFGDLAGASAIVYVGIKVISADSAVFCKVAKTKNLAKVSRYNMLVCAKIPTPSFTSINTGHDRFVHETGFEFQAFESECYALF